MNANTYKMVCANRGFSTFVAPLLIYFYPQKIKDWLQIKLMGLKIGGKIQLPRTNNLKSKLTDLSEWNSAISAFCFPCYRVFLSGVSFPANPEREGHLTYSRYFVLSLALSLSTPSCPSVSLSLFCGPDPLFHFSSSPKSNPCQQHLHSKHHLSEAKYWDTPLN